MNIKLSIIIPSTNDNKYVDECLKSFYKFKFNFTYEIIVIDNGSKIDESILLKSKYHKVVFKRLEKNLGYAGAINEGLNISKGEYVLLPDADTVFLDDKLNNAIKYMDTQSNVGILGPRLLYPNGELQRSIEVNMPLSRRLLAYFYSSLFLTKLFKKHDLNPEQLQEVTFIVGSVQLVRRKMIYQIGMLDTQFFFSAEERDWCLRAMKDGWKLIYYPDWKMIHYGGGVQGGVWYLYNWHSNSMRLYKKYWGIKGLILSKIVFVLYSLTHTFKSIIKCVINFKKDPYLYHNWLLLIWHFGFINGDKLRNRDDMRRI
ncbi:MAG: glycosyltransferase family 2 protein [Calditrichaceae bacterium]|nr:glycosyltransferase family 2 protein [Calditrichaceae bacterium]MBN2707486.1 glycosyltransferase family 2 protein [Calditrichaceae bacterium]RQV95577.1 MAG: glycosyltransferase family 2 protein [Calditrichota bacterium]